MHTMKFEDFEPSEESFDDFMPSLKDPKPHLFSNDWYCSTSDNNHDCFNLFVDGSSSN